MRGLKVLMMRHARSDFNEITMRSTGIHNFSSRAPFLKDAKLSYKGVIECRELGKTFQELGIKLIFVSPMRRCLETAFYIFDGLKSAHYPKIIVNPNLMERVARIVELPTFFTEAMKMSQYKHFDFSGMKQAMLSPLWDFPLYDEHREIAQELLSFTNRDERKNYLLKFPYFEKKDDAESLIETTLQDRIEAFEEEFNIFIENYRLKEEVNDHQVLLISHFNWIIEYVQMKKFHIKDLEQELLNLKTLSVEMSLP